MLFLSLFTFWVGLANHINDAFTTNDLAVGTYFFHTRTYFHDFSMFMLMILIGIGRVSLATSFKRTKGLCGTFFA